MTAQTDIETPSESENASGVVTLTTRSREKLGTARARNYRKEGLVPAVAYELGKPSIAFLLEDRDFRQKATKALTSQVFTLTGEVKDVDGRKALVKEVQRDGLKGDVLHIDFLLLEERRPASVIVPVVVSGEAPGVKQEGGVLNVQCREVTVFAAPESIPSEIEVSVASLRLGQRIRAKDIEMPEGVVLRSSPEETVANVVTSRASKTDTDLDAAGTAEAGSGEGAAPAAAE
jgi:large subunit ribosomal protein L25